MVTKAYELMFIVNPKLSEEETKALIERIRDYIEGNGGQIFDLNHWGIRRLAYTLKNHREGRYYLTHFTMPSENINSVKHRLLLIEDVLRELITQYEGELVMQKPELAQESSPAPEPELQSEVVEVEPEPEPEQEEPEPVSPDAEEETSNE